VVYAGGGKDADSLIERVIDACDAPKRLTVVSSDRRLQRAARRRGASFLDSDTFLRRAHGTDPPATEASGADPGGEDAIDAAEVEAWMEVFGDADRPRRRRSRAMPEAPPAGSPPPPPSDDPLIADAERAWPGRIRAEDLDMERWLDESGGSPGTPGRGP